MAPKLLTEFVGTFFLVLVIGLSVSASPALAALAIGSGLMAMIYMGGHVSGAHYNPAVTLAVWMRRRITASEAGGYVGVQILAALVASLLLATVLERPLTIAPVAGTTTAQFFVLEMLFTFALVLVILNVATTKGTAGNGFYGLAIGFTVLAGALAAGPISGAAFNPAVALGPILTDVLFGTGATLVGLPIYLVSTLAGGALAALFFGAQNPTEVRGPVAPVDPPSP